jgi:parvulin-like peptidyl-prolyl isomerase
VAPVFGYAARQMAVSMINQTGSNGLRQWLWLAIFAAGISGAVAQDKKGLVDGVAAVVNDRVITYSDVMDYVQPFIQNIRRDYSGAALVEKVRSAQREALDDLIDRALILDEFKTKGYTLPETAADNYINDLIGREYNGDRTAFLKTLEARNQTLVKYREQTRDRIIVQAMQRRQLDRNVVVSPYKIDSYYQEHKDRFHVDDQIKLRIIYVKRLPPPLPTPPAVPVTPVVDGTNPPSAMADTNAATPVVETLPPVDTARQLADEIVAKLDKGENFEKLARAYSEGKEAKEGGDWGWIGRDVLRKELNTVAFQLKPSEHSPVIETAEGYYLLQVDAVKPAYTKPLTEVRNEVEQLLLQEQHTKMQADWVKELRAKAYIRLY